MDNEYLNTIFMDSIDSFGKLFQFFFYEICIYEIKKYKNS